MANPGKTVLHTLHTLEHEWSLLLPSSVGDSCPSEKLWSFCLASVAETAEFIRCSLVWLYCNLHTIDIFVGTPHAKNLLPRWNITNVHTCVGAAIRSSRLTSTVVAAALVLLLFAVMFGTGRHAPSREYDGQLILRAAIHTQIFLYSSRGMFPRLYLEIHFLCTRQPPRKLSRYNGRDSHTLQLPYPVRNRYDIMALPPPFQM